MTSVLPTGRLRQPDGKLSPAAFSPVSRAAAAQLQASSGGANPDAAVKLPMPSAEPVVVFTLAWQRQLMPGARERLAASMQQGQLWLCNTCWTARTFKWSCNIIQPGSSSVCPDVCRAALR